MKKKTLLLIFTVYLSVLALAGQTGNLQNYVSIHTKTDEAGIGEVVQIKYFDGLGRLVQTVQKNFCPSGKDLVTNTDYDYCGRVEKEWLPTPIGSGQGYIKPTDFANLAKTYYGDTYPYKGTQYSTNGFLDRVVSLKMPGDAFQDHPVYPSVSGNNENEIRKYVLDGNNNLRNAGYYDSKTLEVYETKDEDGHLSYQFKDRLNRIIMARQINGSVNHDTYYVYDDFGNLVFVLPPLATDNLAPVATWTRDNDVLKKYAYVYRYDSRKRQIEKKIPGCEPVYMVYDKADRLILSQDGVQRTRHEWTVNKYDMLGRLLYTCVMEDKNRQSADSWRQSISQEVVTEEVSASTPTYQYSDIRYTKNWFGNSTVYPSKLLAVSYYDNYDFLDRFQSGRRDSLAYQEKAGFGKQYSNAKDLPTGTRVYQLDDPTKYTVAASYYDEHGKVVQTRSTNHMGGYDIAFHSLNFNGLPVKTQALHNIAGSAVVKEEYSYAYDHALRLLTTWYRINDNDSVLLASNTYDELGRLAGKQRHNNLQQEEFSYNIRSWPTRIKSGGFEENLYYNTNVPQEGSSSYNGNIAYSTWTYGTSTRGYQYNYDGLSRFTGGYCYLDGELQVDYQHSEWFNYDKHGNIYHLDRYDGSDLTDQLTLQYNGNQVVKVTDGYGSRNQYAVKEYQDKADKAVEYAYDANGNMVKDLDRNIVAIRYNLLNLPDTVQFANGNQIVNRYDASGRKLGSRSMTLVTPLVTPVSEGTILGGVDVNAEDDVTASGTDYVGNVEYTVTRIYDFDVTERPMELYSLSRLYNPEGYSENITTGTKIPVYSYYSKDHLGNNREVWRAAYYRGTKYYPAAVTQRTQYYPSGLPWSESLNPDAQKRKYNGKEFVETNGYDTYDYEARGMYPAIMRFTTVDPLGELHYDNSPYVYVLNNPLRYIDPNGCDTIYAYSDGTEFDRITADGEDVTITGPSKDVVIKPTGQSNQYDIGFLGYFGTVAGTYAGYHYTERLWGGGYFRTSKGSLYSLSVLKPNANGKYVRGVQGLRYGAIYAQKSVRIPAKIGSGISYISLIASGYNFYNDRSISNGIDVGVNILGIVYWESAVPFSYFQLVGKPNIEQIKENIMTNQNPLDNTTNPTTGDYYAPGTFGGFGF